MTKDDIKLAKKKILKCLTEEFEYGRRKDGKPLKRPHKNLPLFNKNGRACYYETDLEMIMDKIMLGLYFAMEDSHKDG